MYTATEKFLTSRREIHRSTVSLLIRYWYLFVITCALTLSALYSSPSTAQQALFQDEILSIPYVWVEDKYYNIELQRIPDLDPLQFELVAYLEVAVNDAYSPSDFYDGLLFVPNILIDGVSYWIELEQIGPARFELTNFEENFGTGYENYLYEYVQPQWQRLEGGASDIGIGADGSVWVIGTDERPGGFGIYYWAETYWQRVDGAAVRIDVGPDGYPWIVNDSHQIYRWDGVGWVRLHGDARDVGIGADGTVWIAAGGGIFRWNGYDWDRTSGSAVRIDVDPWGTPWVVDHTDDVYELIAGRWIKRPGAARDVGIGADGSVWVIGTSSGSGGHDIFQWDGASWQQVFGSARQISVGPDGLPWVLGTGGEIYRGL